MGVSENCEVVSALCEIQQISKISDGEEEDMLTTGCCGLRCGPLVSERHPLASLANALQRADTEQVLPECCAGVKGRLSDLPNSHQN